MKTLTEKITEAVLAAAKLMTGTAYTVSEKGDAANLVTSADTAVENYLRAALHEILPEAGFLGEEGDNDTCHDLLFVVDPIDGTTNFTRGMGLSAISVGLVCNSQPTLGVIYNPFTRELFTAERGCGAYLRSPADTEPVQLHVSDRDFCHGILFTAFSLYRKEYSGICQRTLGRLYPGCNDFRRLGSAALELAYLSAGRAEMYFEMRLYPWDACAGILIITEAGGIACNPFSEEIDFTKPFPLIAANNQPSLARVKRAFLSECSSLPGNFYD